MIVLSSKGRRVRKLITWKWNHFSDSWKSYQIVQKLKSEKPRMFIDRTYFAVNSCWLQLLCCFQAESDRSRVRYYGDVFAWKESEWGVSVKIMTLPRMLAHSTLSMFIVFDTLWKKPERLQHEWLPTEVALFALTSNSVPRSRLCLFQGAFSHDFPQSLGGRVSTLTVITWSFYFGLSYWYEKVFRQSLVWQFHRYTVHQFILQTDNCKQNEQLVIWGLY